MEAVQVLKTPEATGQLTEMIIAQGEPFKICQESDFHWHLVEITQRDLGKSEMQTG